MIHTLRTSAGLLAVVVLCALLLSDQARHLNWLKEQAKSSTHPENHWYQAALQGDQVASNQLLEFAIHQKQPYWLSLLFNMGSLDALYNMALLESDSSVQKRLLGEGAQAGHAPSQYELSLLSDSSSAKLLWLQKAAGAGHLLAQIALYQWHMLHNELDKALPWLAQAAEVDAQSALLFAKILWKDNKHADAKRFFALAVRFGEPKGQEYLQHIDGFWNKSTLTKQAKRFYTERSGCHMRLQFVANSLESIMQATAFQQKFADDKRLEDLSICVNPPIWQDELSCSDNWQGHHRLGCNIAPLIPLAEQTSFSHLVVFAQQGKANVHNGIMYLDLADTYSVFVHELAHFAGFIDEYPLSSQMAEIHCYATRAPNVLIKNDEELPSLLEMEGWLQDGFEVSLARTRTCNNHSAQAFKPTQSMTFMEYHDQGVIPPLYLSLWRQLLENPQNLTPAYVNFAQYQQSQGNQEQAQYWWQIFEQYRGAQESQLF